MSRAHLICLSLLALSSPAPSRTDAPTPPAGDVVESSAGGVKLVYIPPGKFTMGASAAEIAGATKGAGKNLFDDEGPQHEVEIASGFYLGMHEVTIGQFKKFVADEGYRTDAEKDGEGGDGYNQALNQFEVRKPQYTWKNTRWPVTDEHPVVNVSWNDAQAFCDWLSRKEKKDYRLPTEAEWEYACRAGTKTAYQHGDDPEGLADVGNVADGTAKAQFPHWTLTIKARDGYVFTAPVGSFRGNSFGLYDMHGNVWEWCSDWYDKEYYKNSSQRDPPGPATGSARVFRGGSWGHRGHGSRSADRLKAAPAHRNGDVGFRLALQVSR